MRVDLASVETNIVMFGVEPPAPDAAAVVAALRDRGVLTNAMGPRLVRVVTHLDVSAAEVVRAAEIVRELLA